MREKVVDLVEKKGREKRGKLRRKEREKRGKTK